MGLSIKAAICALHVGMASWYGYTGHRTASGAAYDTHALTAASPDLPFGSHVAVTNLDDPAEPTVVLKITDRGPFAKGRILDVTPRAATELRFKRAGQARIFIEVLCDPQKQRSS